MNGDLIVILLVIAAAILAVLVAKLAAFWRGFAEKTRYLCHEMDHADSYKEYYRWRGELRCHYLCLIPFVNRKNVMCVYRFVYRRGDHAKKKERKDSLVPLLLPSILGIFICTVCVCSMTWAWYTASVEAPAQKMTAAYYTIIVETIMNSETKVEPNADGSYPLNANTPYTITLKADGTVKDCGGHCLIENAADSTKTYTQIFKPGQRIIVPFTPTTSGNHTFTGVWGSHPAGTTEEKIIKAIDSSNPNDIPIINDPVSTEPIDQPSEPAPGTYTVQSGDTLSGIAKNFNTTVDKIAAYNGITDKEDIKAGQALNIPSQDYEIPEPIDSQESMPPVESDPAVTDLSSEPMLETAPEPSTAPQTELVSEAGAEPE